MTDTLVKSRTLYEIDAEMRGLEDALEDLELTEEQQKEAIQLYLEGPAGEELDAKVHNYVSLLRECEAKADIRKREATLISAGAQAYDRIANRLKTTLCEFMQTHSIPKFEGPRYTVTLTNNGGVIPLLMPENLDAEKLPEKFRVVTYTPNTKAIREALEAEEKRIEAVELLAKTDSTYAAVQGALINTVEAKTGIALGVRGKHIRVK